MKFIGDNVEMWLITGHTYLDIDCEKQKSSFIEFRSYPDYSVCEWIIDEHFLNLIY